MVPQTFVTDLPDQLSTSGYIKQFSGPYEVKATQPSIDHTGLYEVNEIARIPKINHQAKAKASLAKNVNAQNKFVAGRKPSHVMVQGRSIKQSEPEPPQKPS